MTESDAFKPFLLLPFPALFVNEKGEIADRNRLAKRLLPPVARLRRLLGKSEFSREGTFSCIELEEISYFVGVLPKKEGRIIVFLENFLPFYESFSKILLKEMDSLFWENLPQEEGKNLPQEFWDSFAARTYRLRREQKGYLRLLGLKEQTFPKPSSCSLKGFFRHLSEVLSQKGIFIESRCPEDAAVRIAPSALTFLILNLAHFAYLTEGEGTIRIEVSEKADQYRISLRFFDKVGTLSVLESLLMEKAGSYGAFLSVPFLCAARLCGRENYPMSAFFSEGEAKIEILLPASDVLPDAFLSEAASEEVKELLRAEKEYFS